MVQLINEVLGETKTVTAIESFAEYFNVTSEDIISVTQILYTESEVTLDNLSNQIHKL